MIVPFFRSRASFADRIHIAYITLNYSGKIEIVPIIDFNNCFFFFGPVIKGFHFTIILCP